VSHVAAPIIRDQRHSDSLSADRSIADAGRSEYIVEDLRCLRIAGRKFAIHRSQDTALSQHHVTARIRMHDSTCSIRKEHACRKTIECFSKGSRFGGSVIDYPADERSPANVRDNQPHTLARFIIDEPIPFVAENAEQGGAQRRFFNRGTDEVHASLRLNPLLVEARFDKFVIGQKIGSADRLPDICKIVAGGGGVELNVGVEI
jgi:predicted RNA-binding protein YlxR (DUF448 family)